MSLQRILIPGLVFQGIVIGGGYSTGRELVEFFLTSGPLGMLVSMLIWSATIAIAFNYAVLTRSYDYASFLRGLLGPLRYPAEAVIVVMALLGIAVITDGAETIFQERLGAPPFAGLALIALGVFAGLAAPRAWLERAMAFWSILLHIAFISLFALVFLSHGDTISETIASGGAEPGWATQSLLYASYNLAIIPAVLFTLRGLSTVGEARLAGALAGVLGMIPAVLFALAMFAFYPEILETPVPLTMVLTRLEAGLFGTVFDIVILGTLLQTVVGTLNAVSDRIAVELEQRDVTLSGPARGAIGLFMVALAIGVGVQFGIVQIIAQGYAVLAVFMILLLVLPIQTVGVWRCLRG